MHALPAPQELTINEVELNEWPCSVRHSLGGKNSGVKRLRVTMRPPDVLATTQRNCACNHPRT